jgi:lipopolysaccharide transport system permease protein
MRLTNPFTTLYRHRDLVVQFTKRELQLRHRGSRLGHFWALLSPMTMLALYLFVFGFIFGGKFGVLPQETTFDYALALFLSLSLYHVIGETIGVAPMLIVNQPNYVKKVVFPLEIIPLSTVASSLYHALLSIMLLLAVAPFSHASMSWQILALPLLLLPLALMALGLAWAFAALGVFVRDISHVTPFLSTAIMFSSAVMYSASKVAPHPRIWAFLQYNPLLVIIDEARKLVLWHGYTQLDYGAIGYVYLVAALTVSAGYILFSILRPYFAEVI